MSRGDSSMHEKRGWNRRRNRPGLGADRRSARQRWRMRGSGESGGCHLPREALPGGRCCDGGGHGRQRLQAARATVRRATGRRGRMWRAQEARGEGSCGRHPRGHWTRAEGGALRHGCRGALVSCLKPLFIPARGRRRFFLRCSAALAAGRLVTWGRGPPQARCVASPCGRRSHADRPCRFRKCPSKLRKIKHLPRKRGATHYRGQTGRPAKGRPTPRDGPRAGSFAGGGAGAGR